jgi:SAM-dependent methyltransferase
MDNIKNLKEAYEKGIYGSEFEKKLAIKSAQVLSNFLNGENVLELGAGFGYTTKEIAKISNKITILDIEKKFLDLIDIECEKICCDWMKFESNEIFSDIVLFRGIDYVKEPSKLLEYLKKFMDKNSKLHILVPNNKSIHRLVGFYAGVDSPFKLSENDINVGHLHFFNLESLIFLLQKSGYKIVHQEGIGFKPLSNSQMDKLDKNIQNAFIEMGNLFIQNAAEVYLVCKL